MTLEVAIRHARADFTLDVAFSVPTPGVVALFGPSGAGKSTVIAAIAGLLRADAARVVLDGQDLSALPPEQRRIGLVFQDGRLFPHLKVAPNLRYGLRRAPAGPTRFDDVVEMLGIGHLLDRRPRTLSGGERQRVAIGRALLAQPRLLLMDEPLASLDASRKAEILPFLARLRSEVRVPIVYVSHALEEVVALADSLVLLRAGRVLAAGGLTEVAARADLPIAARDDAGSVLDARITQREAQSGLAVAVAGGFHLRLPHPGAVGTALRVRVLAKDVILATEIPRAISVHNVLPGAVRAIVRDAADRTVLVEIESGGAVLLARVTEDAITRLDLEAGRQVLALIKSVAIQVV